MNKQKLKAKQAKNIFALFALIVTVGALVGAQQTKTLAASLECTEISNDKTAEITASFWDINKENYNSQARGITEDEYNSKTLDEKSNIDSNLILFGTSDGKVTNGVQNGFTGTNEKITCNGVLQSIVKNKLENGNITLSDEYQNKDAFFPTNSENCYVTNSYIGCKLQVLKEQNGFYSFDSNEYHLSKDNSSNTFKLHKGARYGFYPMNSCEDDTSVVSNRDNYFTAKFEIPFIMSDDGKMYNPDTSSFEDMVFNISGNDDIWVFIDDNLVADLGGIHTNQLAKINLADKTVTYSTIYNQDADCDNENAVFDINSLSAGNHNLKIFYASRSGNIPNLSFNYNLQNTGVKVVHKLQDSNDILKEKYIITPEGTTITTSREEYTGTRLNSFPESEQITISNSFQTINYVYEKVKTLTVDYIDKVENKKIAETSQMNYYENDTFSVSTIYISDYNYVDYCYNGTTVSDNEGIIYGKIGKENVNIIIYYKYTNASVTANYVDKDTGKVMDTDVRTGIELEETEFSHKEFEGYTIIEEPDSNKQQFTKKGNIVTYYYEKLGKITINYIDNISKQKIIDSDAQYGKNGEKVKIDPKEIDNYGICKSPSETEYTFDKNNDQTINFYYLPQHEVVINYIDQDSKELIFSNSGMYNEGKLIRSNAIPFENYRLVKSPQNSNFVVGKNDVTINYYYVKKKCNLSVSVKLNKAIINDKYYDLNRKISKAEIPSNEANSSSSVIIYYNVTIKNTGGVAETGNIYFSIPLGYEINAEDSNNNVYWTVENGRAYRNTWINVGESETYPISIKKIADDNSITGTIRGCVDLEVVNLPSGFEEETTDDNTDYADLVIAPRTGTKQKICFIAFLAIALVILIFYIDKKLGNDPNKNNKNFFKDNNKKLFCIKK